MFFGRTTLSQQGGSNSQLQAHKPKSPPTSVQDPSQLQGGPLSGPTLSPTPSAPTCLATGWPESIVTFSRPRSVKLWTSTRGAWHGHNKNPIPDPLGWKPRNKRVSTVSLWRRLRDDNRGLRPRKFEARRQCSTLLFAQAWCHIQGRASTKAPEHWILNRMPPSSTERAR